MDRITEIFMIVGNDNAHVFLFNKNSAVKLSP